MTDVYKIGVKLAFSGNATQFMAALANSLGIVDAKVAKLTKGFGGLKLAVAGALSGFAAEKLLSSLTGIVERTADLSHELTQIAKLGQSAGDVATANSAAINVTRAVRGITQTQALDIYSQLYSLVGKQDALNLLAPLSKFDVVMGNTTGDMGAAMSGSRDMVRAAEQMGRLTNPKTGEVDTERFKQFLDLATKIGDVTHGAVNAETWLNMAKMGGPALMGMNDRSLGTMAILSQYMGGPRAGTSMMSLFSQMSGGVMFARSAQEMQNLGLLKADEWSTKGGRVILTPEARQRLGGIFQDPLSAVKDTLVPAMAAHGYDTPQKQVEELFAVLGRQTTQRAIADIVRNYPQMINELGRMDAAPGLDKAYGLADSGDVKQNLTNLTTAFQNFWYAVAGPNSETELSILHSLTAFVGDMTKAVQGANPTAIKIVGESLVGLFTGLTVFAGGALLSVLVGIGAIPAAIAAVVAALGTLVVMNWSEIKNGINWIGDAIAGLWNKLKAIFSGGADSGFNNDHGLFAPGAYHGGGQFMPIGYTSSAYGLGGSASSSGGATGAGIGTRVPGGLSNPLGPNIGSGVADSIPVPQGVLSQAAAILRGGGSSAQLQRFMASNGYPKSGNWCGEFAAAVVRSAGGTPPPGAAVASNWRRWGQAVSGLPQIGDIAVRNGVATGYTGSHVGFVVGVDPQHGTFLLEGGNQGPAVITQRLGRYSFRHGSGVPNPRPNSEPVQIHKHYLDGKQIAANTVSHVVRRGNMVASGGRMTDTSLSRPISI